MQTLALRLLGDLDVDGVDLRALGSRKARALLWLLALGRGTTVPIDAIVDALWRVDPPARPIDQVAVLVSRVRAVLGRHRVERTDSGYRLRYDWLDVDEVAALTAAAEKRAAAGNAGGAAAAARVAMSLLRAAPVPPDGAGPWVDTELASLERLATHSRLTAASVLLTAGSWLEAAEVAAVAVQADGYDEHAVRLLMRANLAGGRAAMALEAHAALRERLADELGADPSAETDVLHTAILRGELPTATDPAPDDRGDGLVGRHEQLARLDAAAVRAREAVAQYVVVEGEAGIGKTRLVRSWVARRPPSDVVLFGACGDLASAAPLDPLLSALALRLRAAGADRSAQLLGPDAPLLAPLLGLGGAAAPASALMADGVAGPTLLYSALATLVERLAEGGLVVLVLDDAHRGGSALAQWLAFVLRRAVRLLVVATVRTPLPAPVPGGERLPLGPLNEAEAGELLGTPPSAELYERSGGHPLFLTELAFAADDEALPASLVEAVSARCDQLGRAGETIRSAAVVGPRLDLDLLAAVLNRPAVEMLDDAETGVAHRLLDDDDGVFRFHHALLRDALAASASAGRAAWLHRQLSRVLFRRPDADPTEVAHHARLGGEVALASRALRDAAVRAAERFDHATAEALLDDALALHPDAESWLARARVRTHRGDYPGALRDVDRARDVGAAAFEVGAWASYFDRRFDQALVFASDGLTAAADREVLTRCFTVAGRTRHARGDLAEADELLSRALESAHGPDRVTAAAWLGVLRSHQSRCTDAIALLRPAARPELAVEHTSAVLHALLFTGHSLALAGRPAAALEAFARYSTEVERRHVPRFDGRGTNFSGWVLRSLGAADEALDRHQQALAMAGRQAGRVPPSCGSPRWRTWPRTGCNEPTRTGHPGYWLRPPPGLTTTATSSSAGGSASSWTCCGPGSPCASSGSPRQRRRPTGWRAGRASWWCRATPPWRDSYNTRPAGVCGSRSTWTWSSWTSTSWTTRWRSRRGGGPVGPARSTACRLGWTAPGGGCPSWRTPRASAARRCAGTRRCGSTGGSLTPPGR